MKQKSLFFIFLFLCVSFLVAQEEQKSNRFRINVDYGIASVTSNLKGNWSVRQDVESYDYRDGGNSLSYNAWLMSCGVKPEYQLLNDKLGILTGIQYLRTMSNLSKDNTYFYLRYKQEGANTEFARIKRVEECSNYIGIPVELKYHLAYREGVSLFVRIGTDFNFKMNSDIRADFVNDLMKEREHEILDNIDVSTKSFYSTFYYSVGLRMGQKGKIGVNAELVLPSIYLTSNNFAIVDPQNFWGARVSLEIPVK